MPDVRIRTPGAVDPQADTAVSDPTPATQPDAEPGAPPGPDPLLGRMLRHFRVESQLGRGGMGAVYRAWDTSLERPVALKVLHRENAETRARFMREARAQARIRHPNVVPIHFVGEDEGIAFLVMELVEGESLADVLDREGRVEPNRAIDVLASVCRALEAGAEHGLVHRDVKPSNILLDRRGHVLLADFGLAKRLGSADDVHDAAGPSGATASITRAGSIVGTPAYAAPEQSGGGPVDHRADVYAVGVSLYEAVTGAVPFTSVDLHSLVEQHRSQPPLAPSTIAPDLPPAIEELVLRALEKRPEDRFPSAAALRAALEAARDRPALSASAFVRGLAALIDLVVTAIPAGLVAALTWAPLGTPVVALLLGLSEGRWGTTPGKRLLRLRVVGPSGGRLGYRRALLRSFFKLWGSIGIGFVGLVVPADGWGAIPRGAIALAWVAGLALVLFGSRRALHDRIVRSDVVYAIH